MEKTKVVHCKHEKYDIYIGRNSIWGNPFSISVYGRKGAVQKYRQWLETQPRLRERLHELKGKTLGCWCKPLQCHGDVLAELADRT